MISVVIPALDEEKHISRCLKSLREQDYKGNYEIIVVDNGSTDNTVGIAKKIGAKVVSCPKKRDIIYARKFGTDISSGNIIVQADADTVYPRDWLTRIAKHFSLHPEAVAVAGNFTYRNPPLWAKFEYFGRNLVNILSVMLIGRPIFISGANFSFYKKAFSKVGGYEKNSYSPDQYGISTRLSTVGKIVYDKDLSVSTSSRRVQKPIFFVLIELLLNLSCLYGHAFKIYGNILQIFIKLPLIQVCVKLIPPILLAVFFAYGYFVPTSPVFGEIYYEGNSSENITALTFDEEPNEPYTSQILDILATYGIKATFFVTGENVELYSETAKRIIAEEHILGIHPYSHDKTFTKECKELKLAQETIFKSTGVKPRFYRPIDGKKFPWEIQCAKQEGLIVVTWAISTDEHEESPESFAKKIIDEIEQGKIIRLHEDKSLIVETLPIIIENLQDKGYRFVTVPELLGTPAYL